MYSTMMATQSPRLMTDCDLDAVTALEASVAKFPWTRGHFSDSLQAGYSCWVLRNADGGLLGYYVLMRAVDEVHLLNIGIDRSMQRQGLGTQLLRHALSRGFENGGRSIFLEVRPSNRPAIELYGRFGFVEIGRRRNYYPAALGREDAIVMRRTLNEMDG